MKLPIKDAIFLTDFDKETRKIEYTTMRIIPTEEITPLVVSGEYTPVKGDRLWFYPGCDIPRFKVKQFCQNNDVAVVKYKEKSSVRFIGPETIKNMVINHGRYCISRVEFLTWFESIMCNDYLQLKADIINSPSEIIYMQYAVYKPFSDRDVFGKNIIGEEKVDYNYITYIKDETSYLSIVDMMNDPLLKHQDEMLKQLNTGSVLDEEMYTQIHRLFESSDKENTKLAMEAMANCDFQKSAVYLLLLVKKYGEKIYNSGNRHHVNFKSLLKYFQLTNITNISVDEMIDSLRHQKLLSIDNLNRLMPLAMEVIRESGDMDNIKVKDVELSLEAEQAIAENILDKDLTTQPTAEPVNESL